MSAQTIQERKNPPTRKNQRGAGRHTLCRNCNSNTGSWYVPAYLSWAQQGWRNAYSTPSLVVHRPFEIEPLAVTKQIIAMFASACGASFFRNRPDLVRFVLNRTETGLPIDVRLYTYYVHPMSSASRQSGITGHMDFEKSPVTYIHAEIAFPPFGYVLCLKSPPPDSRLFEITFMADASPGEMRTLNLKPPALHVNSFVPCDFRSEAEIDTSFN